MMRREYFYQRKLRDALSDRMRKNPRYSLRSFARTLDMDPGALSKLLSGKRFPSKATAEKIFRVVDLSPTDRDAFLRSLAEAKRKAGLRRISPELRDFLRTPSSRETRDLSLDVFKTISDWYYAAILELPLTRGFDSSASGIARALGVSVGEAHAAIQRLLDLGLLEISEGELFRADAPMMTVDRQMTSLAHRNRQKQILEKSSWSLSNDPLEQRNHTAMTFAIDTKKIPEAKRRIEAFLSEMNEFLGSGERDRVYEMTVNLFPLQMSPPPPKKGPKS